MDEHANLRQTTHYQILGISSSILDSHHDASSVLKQAYRRALLQNHPDKAASGTTRSSIYTVDQITTAFNILSSPKDRAAYDTALRLARAGDESETQTKFQTGVENIDLDDLPYDEAANCWYRSCRCGNERAYQFREDDLDEYGNDGELMVGCQDCSLWLRIHFAMVEHSGEDEA